MYNNSSGYSGFEEASAYISEISLRKGKRLKAFVQTFGCQQNEADSEHMMGLLIALGYEKTDDPSSADIILVNTCSVREHAEIRALSVIGNYKKYKEADPDVVIGVFGCMMSRRERVEQIKNSFRFVDFTLPPSSDFLLPACLLYAFSGKRYFCSDSQDKVPPPGIESAREYRYKAYLSIMYGCNNFCSYCIVPYVRGRERSRDYSDVISEAEAIVRSGAKEIMLLGQNVNSYRGGISFAELLRRVADIDGDFVVRFMTSHPKDVSDDLIHAIASNPKIERHFHLPLQSGSDRILKDMNRHYDLNGYFSTVGRIRDAVPDISLTSDIIVGFPGETEDDFSMTMSALERAQFDMIYSFIYSPRPGTPAASRTDQIPKNTVDERFSRLLDKQKEISYSRYLSSVGETYRVLCDSEKEKAPGTFSGRALNFKLVSFSGKCVPGEFYNVKIDSAEPYSLHGRLIDKED